LSFIKKHTWKGLTVAAAMLLSVGLMNVQTAQAAYTISVVGSATVNVPVTAQTGTAPAFTAVSNATVTAVGGDFPNGSTVILTAPTGWRFDVTSTITATPSGGAVNLGGGAGAAAAVTPTATTATWTSTAATATAITVTFSNITIQPTTTTSNPGAITLSGTAGLSGVAATIGNSAVATVITTNTNSVLSDGSTSATLSITVRAANGAIIPNMVVSLTTNRGTLSASSSTTSSISVNTGPTGTVTNTFRGNGTTGTVAITGTTAAPNASVGTLTTIVVVSPSTSPTGVKFFSANNSAHVAASAQNVYTTPTLATRIRFQVTDGAGNGVNGQLVQVTVDKGNVVQGDFSGNPTAGNSPGTCAGNNVSASDTSTGPLTIDGVDYDGIVVFTVCARPGQAAGPIKVTAKNLSTTMADATTNVTSAGVPNRIEATTTGGAVTVTIKDKDGNEAADGTTVSFGVPAFTGTVAPVCSFTVNGKATASAAFSGTGGQVLITVFINDSGTGNSSTCAALGNAAAVATTVTVGAGAPVPGGPSVILGTVPSAGRFGLIGVASATTVDALVAAARTAGCSVVSLSITSSAAASGWLIHIVGAPGAVNTAFPGTAAVPAGGAGLNCG
jgi:adhesin/invasin